MDAPERLKMFKMMLRNWNGRKSLQAIMQEKPLLKEKMKIKCKLMDNEESF